MYKSHKIVAYVDAGETTATCAAFTYEQFLNMFTEEDAAILKCSIVDGQKMKFKTAGELKKYCKKQLAESTMPNKSQEHQMTVDEWIKMIPNY